VTVLAAIFICKWRHLVTNYFIVNMKIDITVTIQYIEKEQFVVE